MTDARILARLDALEADRQALRTANERWRRGALVALTVAGVLLCVSQATGQQAPAKVVEASEYRVRANGQLRAILGVDKSNQVSLAMTDPNEKVRAMMSVTKKGTATFSFVDPDGSVRATFSQGPGGDPTILFRGKTGALRMQVSSEPSGIVVYDEAGKAKAAVVCKGAGPGMMQVRDASGEPTFSK